MALQTAATMAERKLRYQAARDENGRLKSAADKPGAVGADHLKWKVARKPKEQIDKKLKVLQQGDLITVDTAKHPGPDGRIRGKFEEYQERKQAGKLKLIAIYRDDAGKRRQAVATKVHLRHESPEDVNVAPKEGRDVMLSGDVVDRMGTVVGRDGPTRFKVAWSDGKTTWHDRSELRTYRVIDRPHPAPKRQRLA